MIRRKKRAWICAGICLSAMVLSGCAETPEEVKKDIADIQNAKQEQKELEQSLNFVNVSELDDDVPQTLSMDLGLFRFEGSVVIPECESAYLLQMRQNDEPYENLEQIMPLAMEHIGETDKSWKDYITNDYDESGQEDVQKEEDTPGCVSSCIVDVEGSEISVDSCGWLAILCDWDPETHPYFFQENKKIRENYNLVKDSDSVLKKEIKLDGKTVSLAALDDNFEKEVAFVNDCSPHLNLMAHDVRIVEDEDTGNQMAVFRALANYKGVFFDSNYIGTQDSKKQGGKSYVGFEMNQQIHTERDNCAIFVRETSFLVSKELEQYDKVLDFSSALSILEKTVPQDKITVIESAEFMYQIYYEGDEGVSWNYSCKEPPEFYAVPVWRFVEKERKSESAATVYYVDAVSGAIYSFYRTCTP